LQPKNRICIWIVSYYRYVTFNVNSDLHWWLCKENLHSSDKVVVSTDSCVLHFIQPYWRLGNKTRNEDSRRCDVRNVDFLLKCLITIISNIFILLSAIVVHSCSCPIKWGSNNKILQDVICVTHEKMIGPRSNNTYHNGTFYRQGCIFFTL